MNPHPRPNSSVRMSVTPPSSPLPCGRSEHLRWWSLFAGLSSGRWAKRGANRGRSAGLLAGGALRANDLCPCDTAASFHPIVRAKTGAPCCLLAPLLSPKTLSVVRGQQAAGFCLRSAVRNRQRKLALLSPKMQQALTPTHPPFFPFLFPFSSPPS